MKEELKGWMTGPQAIKKMKEELKGWMTGPQAMKKMKKHRLEKEDQVGDYKRMSSRC
jgi:hypothetical protein